MGLRCLAHDSYYYNKYNYWSKVFKNSLIKLDKEINYFIKNTSLLIDFSKYDDLSHDDIDFISFLIDIYLEDD